MTLASQSEGSDTQDPVEPLDYPPDVYKKANKMREKSEFIHRVFEIGTEEQVIQDYRCSMREGSAFFNKHGGRLYITQNYMCFHSSVPLITEAIPFSEVIELKQDSGILAKPILVHTEEKEYTFSGFVLGHGQEAFCILHHLWKFPPSYVLIDPTRGLGNLLQQPPAPEEEQASVSSDYMRGQGPAPLVQKEPEARRFRNQHDAEMAQEIAEMVDTETTKRILKKALECRQIGTASLEELSVQADALDRIERDLEEIHGNLDHGEKFLRGIESVGSAITNNFSKYAPKDPNYDIKNHTISVKRQEQHVDMEILVKFRDDSLSPALLRFEDMAFMCTQNDKPIKGFSWTYDQLETVIVRARPLHVDFRFRNAKRFRLFSSFVQPIVNEVYLRALVDVLFEPNTTLFQYGSRELAMIPTAKSAADSTLISKEEKANAFRVGGRAPKTSDLLGKHIAPEVKQKLDETDRDLDDISRVLGDLNSIGLSMGQELDRQCEQVDRVIGRVDKANARVHRDNYRVRRMIH